MRNLCDSNVLIALVSGYHPQHVSARDWLSGIGEDGKVMLCRMTQLTCLRLLTVDAVMMGKALSNSTALETLSTLMEDSRFAFIEEEPPGLREEWFGFAGAKKPTPNIWMDAYLAALAKGLSYRLVTFDKGFERWRSKGLDLLLLS